MWRRRSLQSIEESISRLEARTTELVDLTRTVRRVAADKRRHDAGRNPFVEAELIVNRCPAPATPATLPETYAQQGEDLIVHAILEARRGRRPFEELTYLDIGANHPISTSNTFGMYRRGCRGVLVEPNPHLVPLLKRHRKGDRVVHAGVLPSSVDDGELKFYVTDPHELSTFDKAFLEDWNARHPRRRVEIAEAIAVPTISIAHLLSECFPDSAPEYVTIDVEGLDLGLVESLNLERSRPWVLSIEWSETYQEGARSRIIERFKRHEYQLMADTGVNGIFADLRSSLTDHV